MKQNWFYKKSSIRKLWWGTIVILSLLVFADFFFELHPHFAVESIYAFYALYGFLTCVVMVIVAKVLGCFIKRSDDYYDD